MKPVLNFITHFLSRGMLSAVFFLILSSFAANADAMETVVVGKGFQSHHIKAELDTYIEKEKGISFEDILKSRQKDFIPVGPNGKTSLGNILEPVWIRFDIENKSGSTAPLYLVSYNPVITYWDMHISENGGPFKARQLKLAAWHVSGGIRYRCMVIPLNVADGSRVRIYSRFAFPDGGVQEVSVRLLTPEAFVEMRDAENRWLFLFYGGMFFLFLYNLFLWISVRDRNYFYYSLLLLFATLTWAVLNGQAPMYLFPNADNSWLVRTTIMDCSFILSAVFTRSFLNTRVTAPLFYRYLSLIMVVAGVNILVRLAGFTILSVNILHIISTGLAFLLVGALVIMLRGHKEARFFLLAWTGLVLGTAFYSLWSQGVLEYSFLSAWGGHIGSAIEAIFLSLALADRINLMRGEKERVTRLYQESLENAKKELEVKVADRTIELQAQKDRAEDATKIKDKFVALVSHDLRSPLANISVAAEILQDNLRRGVHINETGAMLDIINSSTSSLLHLIDQLLDIGRLQSGKVVPARRTLNLHNLVELAIQQCSGNANAKGIALVNALPPDTKVAADPDLLAPVVINLLTNAVKFTSRGGQVRFFAPDGTPGTFAVSDTGNGIRPELLPDIFRHDAKTSTLGTAGEQGTGFGLPLCMDIVKAHNGDLRVETEPGKGSVFFIHLPWHHNSVLIVDDQEAHRRMMKDILSTAGVEATVLEASDGGEALEELRQSVPNLIISDIHMEPMSGMELLQTLKADDLLRGIPVIMATSGISSTEAVSMDALREKVMAMGAADFIIKPVIKEEFLLSVQRCL